MCAELWSRRKSNTKPVTHGELEHIVSQIGADVGIEKRITRRIIRKEDYELRAIAARIVLALRKEVQRLEVRLKAVEKIVQLEK